MLFLVCPLSKLSLLVKDESLTGKDLNHQKFSRRLASYFDTCFTSVTLDLLKELFFNNINEICISLKMAK